MLFSKLMVALSKARAILTEMREAQDRLFEIRTGIPAKRRGARPATATTVAELDALYAQEDPRLITH
jgi:hypothetical protein